MAISGILSITYATDDLQAGRLFHEQLGLTLVHASEHGVDFALPDGSSVRLRPVGSPDLPAPLADQVHGVREVCWAVSDRASLAALAAGMAVDRPVHWVGDSECAFLDDAGLTVRLRVAQFTPLPAEPDPTNAPGRVERLNQLRRWHERAVPLQMQHVVFSSPQARAQARFYVQRLGFRISDIQEEGGVFLRAPGNVQHHNLYWQRAEVTTFRHVSYGVANIDALMAGAAHMARHGVSSRQGLGRHRISSTFFYYMPNPCGGDAEYSTDADCLDDRWAPRVWGRVFGHIWWLAQGRDQEPEVRMRMATADDLKLL